MAQIPSVDSNTFVTEVLRSPEPVLVEFGATWCGPCKALAPTLDALSADWKGRIRVRAVDVDASPDLAATYKVRGVPTLLIVQDGQVVSQQVGNMPRSQLKSWVEGQITSR